MKNNQNLSSVHVMKKGGAREGAGRKKGVPNKSKQELLAKAAEKGIEPIMQAIESASYAYELARNAQDPLEKLALYKTAHELNNDLLPYFHRKMPVAVETKNTTDESVEETVKKREAEVALIKTLYNAKK